MRIKLCKIAILALLGSTLGWPMGHAQEIQHSDVSFFYGETKIEIDRQGGRLALPQVMPQGGFFAQSNVNPGFFSERDTGGGTGPNDIVGYNVLDDIVFWTDGAFATPRSDTGIRVINNPRPVPTTFVGTGTGEQLATFGPLHNTIGQSSGAGDFHAHVDFRLEPLSGDPDETPLPGAYGLKLSLSSDNPAIQESDPFFIVYRFGMEEGLFEAALDDFEALLNSELSLLGDFNADGVLNADDMDLLSQEAQAGTNQMFFDLTNDALVNEVDRKTWVEDLAGTYFGDADLDGNVAFSDFLALSAGFGGPGGWSQGDFDGDGQVQFADFLRLSNNFGESAPAAMAVPEPSMILLAFTACLAMLLTRQPHDSVFRGKLS